jgi:tRNA A-37 threonylcarbamoyl transferase component Bud32/tetratricopeptide (TPR) repeat protein
MGVKCPKCHFENPEDTTYCGKCATPLKEGASIPQTRTLETPAQEMQKGKPVAGKYKIIEELGRGGMGVVYKAEDTKLKRPVALKFLSPELTRDSEVRERFIMEAQSAAVLSHPNICTVYEIEEEEGKSFIAMEYIKGQSLKQWIEKGPLKIEDLLSIGIQVAEGLHEAHTKGIVHRDIKSSNIMITDKGLTKLMDFGLAKLKGQTKLTKEGAILGTVAYMSPEQAKGEEVDLRSDIWSLGVVLYEMVSGLMPFKGTRDQTVIYSIKNEEPEPLTALRTGVPMDLERIIQKCLSKKSTERYQHTDELIVDLQRLKKDTERVATGVVKPVPVRRKRRIAIAVSVMVAAAALVAAAFLFWPSQILEPDLPRIAIAVFENKTGDSSLDRLGSEIQEWLVQGLHWTGLVAVVPLSAEETVAGVSDDTESINQIALNKGAHILVSGTYFRQGEDVRFHGRITDTKEGDLLQALEPVSGPIKDPSEAMDVVRQRMMGAMAFLVDPELGPASDMMTPPVYEAWQAYNEAFGSQHKDWKKAIELYKKAYELDPSFIIPMLRLSFLYFYYQPNLKMGEAILRELNKSREKLDPVNSCLLDYMLATYKGDWEGRYQAMRLVARYTPSYKFQWASDALAAYRPREAIEILNDPDIFLAPNYPKEGICDRFSLAYHMLSKHKKELKIARQGRKQFPKSIYILWLEVRALAALGRLKEINELIDESFTVPSQGGWNPGEVMRLAGNELRIHGYRDASYEILERAISWYKSRKEKHYLPLLARSYYYADRWEESLALYEELHREFPDNIIFLGYLGILAARMEDKEKALKISEELKSIERPYLFGNHTHKRADIAALLGEKEEAMRLLHEAYNQGRWNYWFFFDMNLESLQDYIPFKEFMKPKG